MPHEFGTIGLMLGSNNRSSPSVTMMGEGTLKPSSRKGKVTSSKLMYAEKVSRTTNVTTKIYSERVSTTRSTSISSKIFGDKMLSSSRTTHISSSKSVGEHSAPSLRSKIPNAPFIRRGMSSIPKLGAPSPYAPPNIPQPVAPSLGAPRYVSPSHITPLRYTPSPVASSSVPPPSGPPPSYAATHKGPADHSPVGESGIPFQRNITRSRVKMQKARYERKISSTQVENRLPTSRTRKSLLPAPKSLPSSVKSPGGVTPPTQSPTLSDNAARQRNLLLGQRVGTSDGRFGILRFKGKTHFSQGCVCGIALDNPVGKNNGIIDGIQYFDCEPYHGIFIPTHKVNILSPSGVTRLLGTPPVSPIQIPRSEISYGGKESKLHSKIPGVGNEKGKTSRPKTLQVFQENKTGTKQSTFKQGNKQGTTDSNKTKLTTERTKSTSGNKLFQNKKVSPVQSKLVLPGWTGDKTPGSPRPTSSRLPELRSKCKGAATSFTVAKDEIPAEETAPAVDKVRKRTTPEQQGSPNLSTSGYKHISRGLQSRPSLNDLTQLSSIDFDTPETPETPLNHPDVLEGCVRVLNKTFDICEASPSSEEEELVSCAIKPLPECVRTPRTLDLTFDLTPDGLPSVTCFPSNGRYQTTSTPVTEPREYRCKTSSPQSNKRKTTTKGKKSKVSPRVDIPAAPSELTEDVEYDEFLAIPLCLDTPNGKCRFDLLTPEEFEQALQECGLPEEEEYDRESSSAEGADSKVNDVSPDRFKPKIWESITVVEDDILTGLDSTFAAPSFLVPTDFSMEAGNAALSLKRDEANTDAEVPCLDELPPDTLLSSPDTINGTFHDDLHARVEQLLKGDDPLLKRDDGDLGTAHGGDMPMFQDDVVNNNNNVDYLVPEDTETDTSASANGLQLSWENMEIESGQRSDDVRSEDLRSEDLRSEDLRSEDLRSDDLSDQLVGATAAPYQTGFDDDDDAALTMGSLSEIVMDGEELHIESLLLVNKEEQKSVVPEHPEGEEEDEPVCDRTFTCDDVQNVDDNSAMYDRTFTVEEDVTTPQPTDAPMFMTSSSVVREANTTLQKADTPIDINNSSPDTPMEYCTGSEPSKNVTGPCSISDTHRDDIVAMDTVTEQQHHVQKTVCGVVTVSGKENGTNAAAESSSSDSGSTMVEDSTGQDESHKTLKRQASPPSELSTVVQVESVEMTSPSPSSIPTYTPISSTATSPSQNGTEDSKDSNAAHNKNLLSKDDSRLPRKRSLLQQPKPVSMCSSSGSETSKNISAAPSGIKPKLPRQKSHEQKHLGKDLKKDVSRKSASNSAMESLSKKTYSTSSWRSEKSATSSSSRSCTTVAKPKTDSSTTSGKGSKLTGVRSKIDTGRRASDGGGKNGQLLKKLNASNSSVDLEPNSLSSSTRSMRSDMSSNGGRKSALNRLPPAGRSAIPVRKNRQSYYYSLPGKPVNKVTQTLKKRDDKTKRRDRKTSTSSINSVESSLRADSRASLSSRPSSRSDVSPDAKPTKRPRQSVRKDTIPCVRAKLNPPGCTSVNKSSRLAKPSSSTIRKQSAVDRGQHLKNGSSGVTANGVVTQVDAAPTRRPGHMSRSSMPSRRSVTGTDSRIGGKPPIGTNKESVPNRTKITKTKGHIATSTQSDVSSPSILSEISRLEALCEARTKELNLTKLKLKSNLQGFDAMSVLVQYLSHQLDAFSTPKLKEQLKIIERQLSATNRRIEAYEDDISRLQYEIAAKEKRHEEEVHQTHDEYKSQLTQLEESLRNQHIEQVETLKQQSRQQLDNSDLEHQNELQELAGVHRMAFREQEEQHVEQVTQIEQGHHDHIEEINREHHLRLDAIQAAAENEQRRLQDDMFTWKYQCESHKEKVAMLQEALRKDSDAKVQAAIAQYKHLPDEVDSMRAVLEMKSTELHDLRIENMNLKKEVERIPDYQERIHKLESKVEELNAIVARKQVYERQLSSEHIALRENYQRENNEKKRLSMENEELAWKLSQSCEAVSPGSLTPPRFNPSPSPTRPNRGFLSQSPTQASYGFVRQTTPAESPESGVFSPGNKH